MATLKTKKMTLALDLSKTQQKKIMDLTIVRLEERKAKMEEQREKGETSKPEKPSSEERFEMINSRLDKQLAHQEQMKQILNNEQYQLWKKISMKKHENFRMHLPFFLRLPGFFFLTCLSCLRSYCLHFNGFRHCLERIS